MLNEIKVIWAKIKAGWTSLTTLAEKDFLELWVSYRTVFILFGAAILTLKFRDLLVDFIVSSSKRLFQSTQKKSDSLETKEDTLNKQADALVQQATQLPATEKPVTDDWNKK
jgi:hypothetical protein